MEQFAIDLRSSAVEVVERSRLSFRERVAAYAELTKPRITFLIVLTSAAGFALAANGRGGVQVNVYLVLGHRPIPMLSIYAASKAALESLSAHLRIVLQPEKIRVTILLSGRLGESSIGKYLSLIHISVK